MKWIVFLAMIRNRKLLMRRLYPLVAFYGKFDVQIQANFAGPFKYDPGWEEA
jgi:hypothetical protein